MLFLYWRGPRSWTRSNQTLRNKNVQAQLTKDPGSLLYPRKGGCSCSCAGQGTRGPWHSAGIPPTIHPHSGACASAIRNAPTMANAPLTRPTQPTRRLLYASISYPTLSHEALIATVPTIQPRPAYGTVLYSTWRVRRKQDVS